MTTTRPGVRGARGLFVVAGTLAMTTGGAIAQSEGASGSQSAAFDSGVIVTFSSSFGFGGHVCSVWPRLFYDRTFDTIVEGPEAELLALEGEEDETESASAPSRTAIELARDLMADRFEIDEDLRAAVGDAGLRTRLGRVRSAIAAYETHLGMHPDALLAQRELAVALLETKAFDRSVDLMVDAYARNPELGIVPVDDTLLGEGNRRLRRMVVRAVGHAQRVETGEAWMLVVVLMQAEGRDEVAARMLDRAVAHGLDGGLATALERGLR